MAAQPPPVDTVADEDLQELRLALVMSGGVSLAVWMGGAAHEFHRVARRDGPVYRQLLEATASKARIDVISGTSAGGLNGALLAMAVVRNSTIGGLRDLWLRLGSLQDLLRPAGDADPPSLMRGDDYFLPRIADALRDLQSGTTSPEAVPMHLKITTTLLRARPRGVPDEFGTIIRDADHRGEFTFERGELVTSMDLSKTKTKDDFADPAIVDQLALASRSTASFPFAFEASFCPANVDTAPADGRPDMGKVANFKLSRYLIDGGVLVNRPLRPALRAIFAQPAGPQVRRVLAYVVPDPGENMQDAPDDQSAVPTLGQVAADSLIRLPRNQSIGNELDEIREQNARVGAQRRRRELAVSALNVDGFARAAYPQYRKVRAERLSEWLFDRLSGWVTKREMHDRQAAPDVSLWQRGRMKGYLGGHLGVLPPDEFPEHGPVEPWFTTTDTVERAGMVLVDLLRRGLGVTDPTDPATTGLRRRLQAMRADVHAWIRLARSFQTPLTDDQERHYGEQALESLKQPDPAPAIGRWAEEVIPLLLGEQEALEPIAARIGDQLVPAIELVLEACTAAPERLAPQAADTAEYAHGLGKDLDGEPLRRLLALEVVDRAMGEEAPIEQRVELIQISADAANGFDATREKPEDKLAGLQLAHFGAFYKRSWRANDWMWGRLDAAQRLAQLLLEPSRLRQLGYSPEGARDVVEAIALGEPDSEERTVLEREDWPERWDRDTALEQLVFLRDPESPLPQSVPVCAQALARRLQLQILVEELGVVADAIEWDSSVHANETPAALEFQKAVRRAEPITAADAPPLFRSCLVGQEKLAAEQSSDLLARTVSQTLAVGTAAASGAHAGLPRGAGRFLRALRGIALVFHLFVSYALAGTKAAGSVATAMLAGGAALLAVGLLVRIPGILLVLGLGFVLGGIVLAAYRQKWKIPWAPVVIAAGIAVSVRVTIWIWDALDDDTTRPGWVAFLERIEPAVVVAGLLVGAHLLGRSAIRWPDSDAPSKSQK